MKLALSAVVELEDIEVGDDVVDALVELAGVELELVAGLKLDRVKSGLICARAVVNKTDSETSRLAALEETI